MTLKRKYNLKKNESFTAIDLTTHEQANVYGGGQSTVVLINSDPDPDPVYIPGDPDDGVINIG